MPGDLDQAAGRQLSDQPALGRGQGWYGRDIRYVDLAACPRHSLERIGCGPLLAARRHGYVIPSRPRRNGFYRGRVLLAGDAAGLTDPITFEGISHALLSGRIAAQAVLDGDLDPSRSGKAYRAGLAREILPELRLAGALARLLYGPVGLRNRLFRRHGDRMVEAMTEVIAGRRTYREYLYSPRRYARLLFAPRRS